MDKRIEMELMNDEEKEIVNETKQLLENLTGLAISERFNNKYVGFNFLINSRNVDILIKVIEKQQTKIKLLEDDLYSANDTIENILNELDRLQKENKELKSDNLEKARILEMFDDRKYRKKYLEERRKEETNLLYPDGDEIYKRYYEQKKQIDLMAEYISNIQDCPLENCGVYLDCENRCNNNEKLTKECWKIYFEIKVKEEIK